MHVVRRRRSAMRNYGLRTFKPRQQRGQLRLHFEDDVGAAGRELRYVTSELDGVAKALLGVQQYRLARQRIVAAPQRPTSAFLLRHAGTPPARFVFLEALAVVADHQQSERLHEMDIGIVLLDRFRLVVTGKRIVEPLKRS